MNEKHHSFFTCCECMFSQFKDVVSEMYLYIYIYMTSTYHSINTIKKHNDTILTPISF